ncbi:MAG: hypothetical protein ACLPKE_18040 [Streptosporangiaceae bacterium]
MHVRTHVEASASGFFTELKERLAIRSISAAPARRDDARKSAEWLAARLRATLGGPGARASHSPIRSPAVRAARRALGRPFGRDIRWEELAATKLGSAAEPRP